MRRFRDVFLKCCPAGGTPTLHTDDALSMKTLVGWFSI